MKRCLLLLDVSHRPFVPSSTEIVSLIGKSKIVGSQTKPLQDEHYHAHASRRDFRFPLRRAGEGGRRTDGHPDLARATRGERKGRGRGKRSLVGGGRAARYIFRFHGGSETESKHGARFLNADHPLHYRGFVVACSFDLPPIINPQR